MNTERECWWIGGHSNSYWRPTSRIQLFFTCGLKIHRGTEICRKVSGCWPSFRHLVFVLCAHRDVIFLLLFSFFPGVLNYFASYLKQTNKQTIPFFFFFAKHLVYYMGPKALFNDKYFLRILFTLGHSDCMPKPHYAHIGPSITAPAAAPAAIKERATNLFNYWRRIKALIFLIAGT